ncbi:restriction endonuclease subunit S [Robertmurraya korlensis]|uniref:restriction endonuclease subunit S n=1 Tax=Robertmurraya korlensis TaxID=519977 RepID=UPI002041D930|nr:restriction endonuclease subunit S [Robertmurraya korlensis]MCM3602464.1 restriction endonuclease subunit S [Robertmurraya korlensis]
MAGKDKKPEIRFTEFTNAWEQRRLGDHAEILTGGTPKTSILEYWEPKEIPWMSSGEVNKRRIDKTDNMISEEGLNNSSARWVKEFSVLIALAGQGKTRGTVAINNIPLTTNQSIAAIVPDETLHYEFIFQNLIKRYDELRMMSSGDGTRGGLNKQIVSDVVVPYTSIEEQEKIGTIFANLDHLITLHQHKYDKLVIVKKSMLEKMFPKDGANVPEIRFAGFTDAWEQHKVGDVLTEKPRPIKMEDDEEYQLVTVKRRNEGIVSRGYLKGKDILVKNYFEIRSGDYLISKRQVVHGANGIVPENLDKSIVSNEYLVVIGNKNITTEYWALISKRPNMYRQFFLSSYGVDIEKLVFDVEDWKKRTIILPSLPEQERITLFFQRLDHLITLYQRELEKLKNIKKSMLEKMFV